MLGYVRPLRDTLKCREFDDYRAVYCGLCRTIGERYGLLARMFLNYDFTFLAMLLMGIGANCSSEQHRCPAAPLQKKCMLLRHDGMDAAADETIILTYWKLRDDIADSSFWKGFPHRVLVFLLGRHYRKAAARCPRFDFQVRTALAELTALEQEKCPSIDRTADTFARILQAAASETGQSSRDRAVGQVLYHVGRWIYLIDAENDLEADRRTGCYNPLIYRFSAEEDHRPYLRNNLDHSLNLAISAFELLESSRFTPVLRNILYLGLPMVEEAVFTGQWSAVQKQISRRSNA